MDTTRAILLPGQGAQFRGMGQDWCEAFPAAKRIFDRADEALGFSLSDICWADGEGVQRTDIAQPGILTTSVAILTCLMERGLDPAKARATAGLSLGEYTSLWCAGALEFEDAVRLVRIRGEAMQAASDATPSSMTSLMGATPQVAEELATLGRAEGICSVANLNAPGQVVISGEIPALDVVEARASEFGIRRAVRLSVAGGFHSDCMLPAAERLAAALESVTIQTPRIPFVSNVSGAPQQDPGAIKEALARQLCSPVRWEESMRHLLGQGVTDYLEPGPGNVLAGLMRRISKDAKIEVSVQGVEHPQDLN